MEVIRLSPSDHNGFADWLALFGKVFEEPDTYTGAMPSAEYRDRLLANPHFIALAALEGDTIIGGLAAYVMPKFERERSEIYIYDLAVDAAHRRKGLATALINETRRIASDIGAWVVSVQADYDDPPAVALYTKLGAREEVLHFDMTPLKRG
ncbi:MAG: AAC(3)-I family aminoglycoside N-acetyltransferase [Oceanicaulis sp.]|uniref:AAC(3)-I family aminoglycoside N-acetyltransferase n=1 Tax=Glycocaulis sp. TaxID=1969725 RepID=UPI0025C026A7|nr:AAC(3)-I family aminoglycoside N-acetyltransferase [Glycocaulis sp.]MCC5980147.1 AAC(3)-I family aminoglycoside N-acetyltransferase [Oceanicaulis sp.]MCH8522493.1 AAC(3)-I family aminoglycoside N-acetyltransferase [Glycocaulis sp.]